MRTTVPERRESGGRRERTATVGSNFLVGVLAQGVASIANIAVVLLVARALGASELGRFSIVFAVLALATAIQSAWVGDALVVLGPGAEPAARWWQHVLTAASVALTAVVIAATGRFSLQEVALYVPLCAAWLYEEFGRQWFMAHHRFVAQGVNDLLYLCVAVGLLFAGFAAGELDLSVVLTSMALAAGIAAVAGQFAVPVDARVWRRPGAHRDLRSFSRYGTWRSAQAASGAVGTVASRSVVADGLGLRTLGDLELGRTVMGPVTTALAGLGNVLLPVASANSRANRPRSFRRMTLVVTSCAGLYGVIVVVWAPFFVNLFGGPGFRVSRLVLAGWALAAVVIALTQSVSVRALVDLPSRQVFVLRGVGTLVTLVLVGAAAYGGSATAVPYATAFGTLLSGGLLHAAMRKGPTPAAPTYGGTRRSKRR